MKINQYNKNSQKHGFWKVYWSDGKLWYRGEYRNGNKVGYWIEMFNSIKNFYLR